MTLITVLAGTPGAGKTYYACQYIRQNPDEETVYFALGENSVGIDSYRLALEFPKLHIVTTIEAWFQALAHGKKGFLEVAYHLPIEAISPLVEGFSFHSIALVGWQENHWQNWAKELIEADTMPPPTDRLQVWRSPLSGQVFDPPSLHTFWFELYQGAYGQVRRAKGIFELPDGRAFYNEYRYGDNQVQYQELAVKRWLEGRPQRFSGIELVGENFDNDGIIHTLTDCCLDDRTIEQYQAQYQMVYGG